MSAQRGGFSLIEVIIAMLILTVGILAMGASTGYVLNQVRASELRTDRMIAVRQVTERLRGTDWMNLSGECASGPFQSGRYSVACEVQQGGNLAFVTLISAGPGYAAGRLTQNVVDTVAITIAQP